MLRKIYLHVVSIRQSINLYNIKNPLDVNLGKLFYFVGDVSHVTQVSTLDFSNSHSAVQ